ncbi:hypothetical protein N9K67_02230 [Opitutaceae bacterium]|jgi:hypothetical protein|nr:hypothetical protein [Opitutaceae bacterium]
MFVRILRHILVVCCLLPASIAHAEKACCEGEVCAQHSPKTDRFQSVREVVDYIIAVAPPQHLKKLKHYSRSEFLGMHFKLDDNFDERLGLKDGNQALLEDAEAKGHRRAWRNIRIALWEQLQEME